MVMAVVSMAREKPGRGDPANQDTADKMFKTVITDPTKRVN